MRKQELHPRTAIINNKQKNQAKMARSEALSWLSNMFPNVFDNHNSIQPLKHGIMTDILAYADDAAKAGISKSKLRQAIVVFTRRIDYLACLKARDMRVDLQGNPVAPVTEEEANHAALKIRKRVEKSAKNSRKALIAKPSHLLQPETNSIIVNSKSLNDQALIAQSNRVAGVLVKHKTSKSYDPNAVARLKEKLGLSRNKEIAE